jgi:hypothetical protein
VARPELKDVSVRQSSRVALSFQDGIAIQAIESVYDGQRRGGWSGGQPRAG